MTSDADLVLQNFGDASETHFLMYEVIQLFLSLEYDETKAPYDIETQDVYTRCLSPQKLPRNIRDFILWQCNVKKRDNEQILSIEIPHGLCKRYDVANAKLATFS